MSKNRHIDRFYIFDLISSYAALSRRQVQALAWGEGNYAGWRARTVLKLLVDEGRLRRCRCAVAHDYVYYAGHKPKDVSHLVLINWINIALEKPGKLSGFRREVTCGGLIADGYFIYQGKPFFLEVQRAAYKKTPGKVKAYTEYFESGAWDADDWPTPGRFARVVVACDTTRERDRLRAAFERDNAAGLRFVYCTVDEIRQDPVGVLFAEPKKSNVLRWSFV